MTRLLVCYPGLLGVSCASRVCGSVGHLIIFQQRQDGDETNQEHKELPLVKWVVIIPGTNVNKLGTSLRLVYELKISVTHRNRERII